MSDSTSDFEKALVARVLAYTNGAGDSVNTFCAGRVYVGVAPDNAAAPRVVLRIRRAESDAEVANLRERILVEINTHHRPRAKAQEAEYIADLAEEAILSWRYRSVTGDLAYGQGRTRETMQADTNPAGRDRVHVQKVVVVSSWPARFGAALTT